MKKIIFTLITIVALTSCQRPFEQLKRGLQASDRTYHIEQYSGGKLIATYDFDGILNNPENSDGYYFYKNDTLIEISGDIIVKSN